MCVTEVSAPSSGWALGRGECVGSGVGLGLAETAAPAPFSYAMVKNGDALVLDSTGSWGKL